MCHDVLRMCIDISSVAIFSIYGVDYCSIIIGITKSETITLQRDNDLSEKSRLL